MNQVQEKAPPCLSGSGPSYLLGQCGEWMMPYSSLVMLPPQSAGARRESPVIIRDKRERGRNANSTNCPFNSEGCESFVSCSKAPVE